MLVIWSQCVIRITWNCSRLIGIFIGKVSGKKELLANTFKIRNTYIVFVQLYRSTMYPCIHESITLWKLTMQITFTLFISITPFVWTLFCWNFLNLRLSTQNIYVNKRLILDGTSAMKGFSCQWQLGAILRRVSLWFAWLGMGWC